MQYVLNEYHRNISDDELIQDVINVAKKLQKDSITEKEYNNYGKYHTSTFEKRFSSWKNVLEMAHLTTKGHNFKYTFSDEDVIADVKRVANICKKESITAREYDTYGTYHSDTLNKRYKTWNNVLKICGLRVNLNRNFTNNDLFEEIERIWVILGRQPTTTDIKKGISIFSLNTYTRRFGGWRSALQAFVDYINEDNNENNNAINKQEFPISVHQTNSFRHKTNRDINLRLRFKVFQRDNFKCCICGASPAVDSSVQLHVDHIKPWSKGGETVLENLQTLCSKCNLGKSDLDMED